jgi:galactokinase
VGVSGAAAEKSGAAREAYNAAAAAALAIEARLGTGLGALLLREAEPGALPDAPGLRRRLEQFLEESAELVPAAAAALAAGAPSALGRLADRSQAGAERALGNQIPETLHLQRAARRLGALAASAFGAGFGGSVWALLPAERAAAFREAWAADYLTRFPEHQAGARWLITAPGPGALRLA